MAARQLNEVVAVAETDLQGTVRIAAEERVPLYPPFRYGETWQEFGERPLLAVGHPALPENETAYPAQGGFGAHAASIRRRGRRGARRRRRSASSGCGRRD